MNPSCHKLSIVALFAVLLSCGYNTYPKKFESGITKEVPDLSAQLLVRYRQNVSLAVTNQPNYRLQQIDDDALRKRLQDLNIGQIDITYEADTSGQTGINEQVQNDIFAQVDHLDSCIQFARLNSGSAIAKWETTYGVIYCFGIKKPRIQNASDEFHSMIRQINDSTIIFRQNLPHDR